jgi:hypothetical protein
MSDHGTTNRYPEPRGSLDPSPAFGDLYSPSTAMYVDGVRSDGLSLSSGRISCTRGERAGHGAGERTGALVGTE